MQYDFKSNTDKILKARESVLNRRAEIIKKRELERDQRVIELQQKVIETIDAFIADIQKFLDNLPEEQLLSPVISVPITNNQFQLFSDGDNYQLVQYRILELGFEFDGFDCQRIEIDTPTGVIRNFSYVIKLAYPDTPKIQSAERALTYFENAWEFVQQILDEVKSTSHPAKGPILRKELVVHEIIYEALGFSQFTEAIETKMMENGIIATVEGSTGSQTSNGQVTHFLCLAINKRRSKLRLDGELGAVEIKDSIVQKITFKEWLAVELRNPHFWITMISTVIVILLLLFAASFSNS